MFSLGAEPVAFAAGSKDFSKLGTLCTPGRRLAFASTTTRDEAKDGGGRFGGPCAGTPWPCLENGTPSTIGIGPCTNMLCVRCRVEAGCRIPPLNVPRLCWWHRLGAWSSGCQSLVIAGPGGAGQVAPNANGGNPGGEHAADFAAQAAECGHPKSKLPDPAAELCVRLGSACTGRLCCSEQPIQLDGGKPGPDVFACVPIPPVVFHGAA
mmetsp:Transcript_50469/g.100437  ORF Transcript_50469/g.100437 Transcript_50469/m.100437 type:complete len:209 (+) Transcript_50469:1203-1829(+)